MTKTTNLMLAGFALALVALPTAAAESPLQTVNQAKDDLLFDLQGVRDLADNAVDAAKDAVPTVCFGERVDVGPYDIAGFHIRGNVLTVSYRCLN